MKYFLLLAVIVIASVNTAFSQNDIQIAIGSFSTEDLKNWKTQSFSGSTDYQITLLDKQYVLKASSHASASGLYKEQRIDLHKTPYLNWRWRIHHSLSGLNEQSKSGDDFSARIYIVISGGWAFWRTKAINYVWANSSKKGAIWPNAFVGKKAMMIALRSSTDKPSTWYSEKRNILEDFKQLFGSDIQYIDGVALMTDTDNSQSHAQAYYGDIYFSAN